MKIINNEDQRNKIIVNIVVLAIALYAVSQRPEAVRKSSAFENLMIDSMAPLQKGVSSFRDNISSFFDHYLMNINASKNNVVLTKKILDLENRIFEFEQLSKENDRLKELLVFGEKIPSKKVLAQIVAWDASSDFKVIRVNKGIKDGVKIQSTVVTSDGLVGYVYRLSNHFADIMTILDSNNRIDGIVDRTRTHGIVEGVSKETCAMKYVTRTEPLILNDLVVTSGLGNIYPKGIKIGRISSIERESYGITQNIEIVPEVNFNKLEEVIILVSEEKARRKKEWEVLDKSSGDNR